MSYEGSLVPFFRGPLALNYFNANERGLNLWGVEAILVLFVEGGGVPDGANCAGMLCHYQENLDLITDDFVKFAIDFAYFVDIDFLSQWDEHSKAMDVIS